MLTLQQHREQGLAHKRAKRLDEAIRSFEQCLALQPADGFALVHLSHIYLMQSRPKLAYEFVEKSLKANPTNHFAIGVRGRILWQMGDLAGAAEAYEEEIAYQPQRIYPYLQLGIVYRKLGRLQDALKVLQQGIEINPKRAELHHAMGDVFVALKQTQRAMDAYEQALALDSADEYAFTRWMELQVRSQKPEQAIAQLRQLLKIPSRHRNPHLHAQLGLQLKKGGKYQEAIEELETAVQLNPDSTYFRTQLAFCYSKQEMYAKALPLLEQIFALRSEDTQIIGAMAKAYFHLAQPDRAKQLLADGLKKSPRDRYLRSVWTHIQQQQSLKTPAV